MNKGAFSYPERFRGESFHGFPSKNKQPLFFGFPSGSEVYDFKCDANTANFAFRITLAAEAFQFQYGSIGSIFANTAFFYYAVSIPVWFDWECA